MHKLKWLLVVPVGVVAVYAFMAIWYSGLPTQQELNGKFIVVNPLDLTQNRGISKYRSSAGHDYRGQTVQGKKETSPRSMKHYIKVREDLAGWISNYIAKQLEMIA